MPPGVPLRLQAPRVRQIPTCPASLPDMSGPGDPEVTPPAQRRGGRSGKIDSRTLFVPEVRSARGPSRPSWAGLEALRGGATSGASGPAHVRHQDRRERPPIFCRRWKPRRCAPPRGPRAAAQVPGRSGDREGSPDPSPIKPVMTPWDRVHLVPQLPILPGGTFPDPAVRGRGLQALCSRGLHRPLVAPRGEADRRPEEPSGGGPGRRRPGGAPAVPRGRARRAAPDRRRPGAGGPRRLAGRAPRPARHAPGAGGRRLRGGVPGAGARPSAGRTAP